jgi:hypothetical protein
MNVPSLYRLPYIAYPISFTLYRIPYIAPLDLYRIPYIVWVSSSKARYIDRFSEVHVHLFLNEANNVL